MENGNQAIYADLFQRLDHQTGFGSQDKKHQTIPFSNLVKRKRYLLLFRVAAVLFIVISAGMIWFNFRSGSARFSAKTDTSKFQEVMPGGNKATLTLANGTKIVLDRLQNGQIAQQAGSIVQKINDGQLVYASDSENDQHPSSTTEWNTVTVPKGGQYKVILSDGTSVYLNSASVLSYPTSFTGKKRAVKLTGEAYFEVAKNPNRPFMVMVSNRQNIEVLGTHFNVEAYDGEQQIKTTLLEGSVRIIYGKKETLLKPDQMALTDFSASTISVKSADTDEVMAWKNGMFIFSDENIVSIMKRLSRWYNIDVTFKGNVKGLSFGGNYSRDKTLSNLLKNIELTEKVHFVTEGRRVTVIAE